MGAEAGGAFCKLRWTGKALSSVRTAVLQRRPGRVPGLQGRIILIAVHCAHDVSVRSGCEGPRPQPPLTAARFLENNINHTTFAWRLLEGHSRASLARSSAVDLRELRVAPWARQRAATPRSLAPPRRAP
eukprot:scaffold6454_cov66-Phaeocystis_antarctica.AAC.4